MYIYQICGQTVHSLGPQKMDFALGWGNQRSLYEFRWDLNLEERRELGGSSMLESSLVTTE